MWLAAIVLPSWESDWNSVLEDCVQKGVNVHMNIAFGVIARQLGSLMHICVTTTQFIKIPANVNNI